MIRSTHQFRAIYGATTVPVLEQVANFDEARQALLAGNIANYDTPEYLARDVDVGHFKKKLSEAINQKHRPGKNPSFAEYPCPDSRKIGGGDWPQDQHILYHDLNNVGLEKQTSEMAKNNVEFNTAINLMKHQMNLLQSAISERV
ncbi:MAG: flagellar basal body rod protein FlgB [Thermoguttaceae bacterium]